MDFVPGLSFSKILLGIGLVQAANLYRVYVRVTISRARVREVATLMEVAMSMLMEVYMSMTL